VRRLGLPPHHQVIVDDAAVLVEDLDRDVADGGGGGYAERRLHVRGDLGRHAAEGGGAGDERKPLTRPSATLSPLRGARSTRHRIVLLLACRERVPRSGG